jgi:hypothetical protein
MERLTGVAIHVDLKCSDLVGSGITTPINRRCHDERRAGQLHRLA